MYLLKKDAELTGKVVTDAVQRLTSKAPADL